MDLKSLVCRELGEGLTEAELAAVVGVSAKTIADILENDAPRNPTSLSAFARYFRMHAARLGTAHRPEETGAGQPGRLIELFPDGHLRRVPLLKWNQIDHMLMSNAMDRGVQAEAMLETDVPGQRTFAVVVRDNSMQPLFREGDIMFVNPDLPCGIGHYVVVAGKDARPESALLRQLTEHGGQTILHPLNKRYDEAPMTGRHQILGRVVRVRKNV
jgi:transcriptional regulator with XRE-family HTH domain